MDLAECSALNHHWVTAEISHGPGGNATITYECSRCHKRRLDTYNLRGLFIISRRYVLPPGEKPVPKGEGMKRSEWRETYLKRQFRRRR